MASSATTGATGAPAGQRSAFFRITELVRSGTGQLTDGLTTFMWTGLSHSAPQGTLDLELMNKTVRKEIPGSNEVVEQGLSSTWQPFDLTGEWDDKWAGPGFAWGIFNDFSIFAQKMPLVRIELDKNSVEGLITSFKVKYRVESKIFWTITISPHRNLSFTAQPTGTELDINKKTIQQRLQELQSQIQSIQNLTSDRASIPIQTTFATDFTNQLGLVSTAVAAIALIATNGLQSDTERELLKAATLFGTVRSTALTMFFFFAQNVERTDVAENDELGALAYNAWLDPARWYLFKLAGLAREGFLDMMKRVGNNNALTIYHPKKGESLERVSLRFYGTPDNAALIFEANHLGYYIMNGTESLIIPKSGTTTVQANVGISQQ